MIQADPRKFLYVDMNDEETFIMVNTVRGKSEGYTRCKIKDTHNQVYKAIELTGKISEAGIKTLVNTNAVSNFSLSPKGLPKSNTVYGTPHSGQKGKTTKTKLDHVNTDRIKIPRHFQQR